MSAQPEALRLADRLEGRWALHPEMQEAAAELRRLSAVEAQRDQLLKALKVLEKEFGCRGDGWPDPRWDAARAAIKAVEEGK